MEKPPKCNKCVNSALKKWFLNNNNNNLSLLRYCKYLEYLYFFQVFQTQFCKYVN